MRPEWYQTLAVNYAELAPPVAGEGESWNDIITTGTKFPLYKGSDKERAKGSEITEDDLDQMISNFERFMDMDGAPRIDTQHATARWETGEATKLRAEVVSLRKVDRDGVVVLQGLFRWTKRGAQEVGDRDWRGFSAELADPGEVLDKDTNEPFDGMVLVGGTLTNDPYWSGMQPVQLSEVLQAQGDPSTMVVLDGTPLAISKEGPSMDLKLMSEKLGTNVSSEDHLVQLFTDLQARATEADKVPDLEEQVQTLTGELTTAKAAGDTATGEVALLSERLGKMEAKLSAEREETAMTRDKDREAVSPAEIGTIDEPGIARRIYRQGVALYNESYGVRPDGYITGGGAIGHNVAPPEIEPEEDDKDTTKLLTSEAATNWLSEQADAWCVEQKVQYTAANVRKFATTLGNEGQRLHTLMMEG